MIVDMELRFKGGGGNWRFLLTPLKFQWQTNCNVERSGDITFNFFIFFAVGIIIIIIVSRTPFKMLPGELFSIVLFTAIIKCLWIVQRPFSRVLSFCLKDQENLSAEEIKLFFFRGTRWSGEPSYIKMLVVDSR